VVGSCSAAISASRHLKDDEGENEIIGHENMRQDDIGGCASHSLLQWAEFDTKLISNVDLDEGDSSNSDGSASQRHVYHCGFSRQEVNVPEKIKLYAG
jgi:hypothetical protein